MNKREKILLQLLISIGVVGGLVVYLLLPQIKKNKRIKDEYELLTVEQTNMEMTMEAEGISDNLDDASENAVALQNYFDIKLNSFTADNIINEMLDKNNLEIKSLNIGKYADIEDKSIGITPKSAKDDDDDEESDDESDDEELDEEPSLEMLERMEISLGVSGLYDDVFKFVDEINDLSKCVEITSMSYTRDYSYNPAESLDVSEENLEELDYVNAQISLSVYKVKSYDEARKAGIID